MSLAVAILNHNSGIMASDGLAWKDNQIVSEDSIKQIMLGRNIAIASCGLQDNTRQLFDQCRIVYRNSVTRGDEPLEYLKGALKTFHYSMPAPEDPLQSRSTAIMLARLSNGRMYGCTIGVGEEMSEYYPEPNDQPPILFLVPTEQMKLFLVQHLALKIHADNDKNADLSTSLIAELRRFYRDAEQSESPRRCNANISMSVFDSTGSFFIPQQSKAQASDVHGAYCNSIESGAVSNWDQMTDLVGVSVPASSTNFDVGFLALPTNGGQVNYWVDFNWTATSATTVTFNITTTSGSGEISGYSTTLPVANESVSVSITNADLTPASTESIHLTATTGSVAISVSNLTMLATNAKK